MVLTSACDLATLANKWTPKEGERVEKGKLLILAGYFGPPRPFCHLGGSPAGGSWGITQVVYELESDGRRCAKPQSE